MMTIASTLGWFSRIVTITVELDGPIVADEGEEFIIPWDSFTGQVALFDCKGNISGRVKILVMEGVRVWHTGLLLNVEQYLHYLDPFVSSDLCAREMKIAMDPVGNSGSDGCWLEGTVYVYFSIPLRKHYDGHDCYAAYTAVNSTESVQRNSQNTESAQGRRSHSAVPITYCVRDTVTSPLTSGSSRSVGANGSGHFEKRDTTSTSDTKDACRWAATYNGEAFGLKHSLMITLCRPWYAHSPELCVPLKLYTTVKDTHEDVERDGEALDSYNSPRPLSLSVVDFTGLCMMTIPSRWVDLDKPVVTKITLRDYSSAVLSIHLLLIRTEYIHDAHKDTIIFVHKVFGEAAEELRDIIPPDALHSSGYVARDDHMGPSSSQAKATATSSEPKEEEPVRGGDGACATFLLEFPMGNASCLCNRPGPSSCSTAAYGHEEPENPMSLSAESAGGLRDSEKCRDESIATGSTSSSSSSSKASSYRDKVLRAKEVESEVQKRLSQLYPSFDTSQPEGLPFALHVALDSDDEEDSDDEGEEDDEDSVGATDADLSQIELQNISLQDPERGDAGSRSAASGNNREEEDHAETYLRTQQIKKLKAAKAELKRSRRSKPYFDFLGDSVSVRYFFRLVVQDGDGECKWNTQEIVLYRSRAPRSSNVISAIEGGAECDATVV